ncbi:hypothetical protein M9H77_21354 [Catharanthus roseus]|uniref:Uncharacterized protein n=1 Tax=Catharanthus roseus TaxID=4058 RepID=A0ACC0AN43_CATRO|nr:hypothetical protein M9H77_21354 [Catharanthus roseus]
MEKKLETILEDLSISLSLNPCLSFYEVSFVELKSLLVSYTLHVGILGDICVISFDGNVFLLMPCMTIRLSSHTSLEDSLMHSGAKFDPSCCGFGMLDYTSFVDPNTVDFKLNYALFDILNDEYLGKFFEDVNYVFPFLGTFMKDLDGVILLNQRFHLLSDHFEFSYNNEFSRFPSRCMQSKIGLFPRAFEERSFHGFRSFNKKFIKDLSGIATLLVHVPKKMIGFTWQICFHRIAFVSKKAYYSTTLSIS